MPTPPATPRTLKVLIGAGLLGLLIWQALPTPPNDSPPTPAPAAPRSRAPRFSAETTPSAYDEQLARMEGAAVDHQQALVRCRSPMLTQRGTSGSIVVRSFLDRELEYCPDCPIVDQTALMMVPVGPTEGYLRIPEGDELALTWPPTQAGVTVDCTSIERIGRSVVISGTARFLSGEAAPSASVHCGRSAVLTDVSGRFELEAWLSLRGEACSLRAVYQNGESRVSTEAVEVTLTSAHRGLSLTFPEYPQWTPPTGASAEEDCARAARLRAYWREEMRPRPLSEVIAKARLTQSLSSIYTDFIRPEVVAEATLALNRMPPPCGEDSPSQ